MLYYKPEFDGLRLFAFFCVFTCHAISLNPWLQTAQDIGLFGMPVFFVLSAYLIVTLLRREKATTGTIALKRFAVRRILRIWPLYFLVIALGFAMGKVWPDIAITSHAVLSFSFLAGNWYVLCNGWAIGVIYPLWSLSIEEQFYAGIPFLARSYDRAAIAKTFCGVIVLAYLVLTYLALRHAVPIRAVWTNSFVQFQFFALGGLIALWKEGRTVDLPLWHRATLFLTGLVLWVFARVLNGIAIGTPASPARLILSYGLVLLGTGILFISVLDTKAKVPSALLYLGKISYGLYMFHAIYLFLIFRAHIPRFKALAPHALVGDLVCLVATIATAAISYHFFEAPLLRLKRKFEVIPTRPV